MKASIFAMTIAMLAAMPASAEERTALPEIIVGSPPPSPLTPSPPTASPPTVGPAVPQGTTASRNPAAGAPERCGNGAADRSLGCLNEKLRREVDRVNPPVTNTAPIDAKSSDLKVGVVNVPAVQQQYGRNFGVSAFPYRPSAPVYSAPLGHR